MSAIQEFLDSLSDPMRPIPGADLARKHYTQFLRLALKFWAEQRVGILAEVSPRRVELETHAITLGDQLLRSAPDIQQAFVSAARTMLKQLGELERNVATQIPGWVTCTREELALFKECGGPRAFISRLPLRKAVDVWVGRKVDILNDFRRDPLGQPAWAAIGNICTGSASWFPRLGLNTGLWAFDGAPWRPLSEPDSLGVAHGTEAVYGLAFETCWLGTLALLPLLEIGAFHAEQAASPWTATRLLDLALGDEWLTTSEEQGSFMADASVGAWSAQTEGPCLVWYDANRPPRQSVQRASSSGVALPHTTKQESERDDSAPWLIGLSARGPVQRDHAAFHRFRAMGASMTNEQAEPYALITAFCLHQLASVSDDRPNSSGRPKRRARGASSDPKADERVWDAWQTGHYKTKTELGQQLSMTPGSVKLAIDRHRKRVKGNPARSS